MNKLMKLIIGTLSLGLLIGSLFISLYQGQDFTIIKIVEEIINIVKESNWESLFFISTIILGYLIPVLMLLIIFLKCMIGLIGRPRKLKIIGLNIAIMFFIGIIFVVKYLLPKVIADLPDTLPEFIKNFLFIQLMLSSLDIHFFIYLIVAFSVLAIILSIIGNIGIKPKTKYQTNYPPQPQAYYPPVFPNAIYCRNCGTQIPAGSQYCSKCGSKI